MPPLKPEELFETAARAICPGEAWQATIADLMGVRRDSVRHLRSGRMPLKPGHVTALLSLIAERRGEFDRVEAALKEWLARQPEEGDLTAAPGEGT